MPPLDLAVWPDFDLLLDIMCRRTPRRRPIISRNYPPVPSPSGALHRLRWNPQSARFE